MNLRHTLATLAVATMLSMPLAAADWMGRGFYEPDTAEDVNRGFMFLAPDTSSDQSLRQVYFSAFGAYFIASPNHNSATLGSQILPYPTSLHAILGVWKDCNKDGYIGLAEGLFAEYRAELLLDASVCPATPTVDHDDPTFSPVWNDGEWVREFIAIGPDYVGGAYGPEGDQGVEPQNNTNHYNLADETARIWGDWGLPSDIPTASCPVNPRPTGTYQSTGGFLRYSDCFTNWRGTGTFNTVASTAGRDDLRWDRDANGNTVAKERPDYSGSPLNRPNPWGQESDASYVTAFDCSADKRVVFHDSTGQTRQKVADPTGSELRSVFGQDDTIYLNLTDEEHNYFVSGGPVVPTVNPSGSAAGTVNETGEALGETYDLADAVYGGDSDDRDAPDGEGTCDRNDDDGGFMSGQVYELDEDPFEGITPVRTQTDVYYSFTEGTGSGTVATNDDELCFGPTSAQHCEEAPWRGWPRDLGQSVVQTTPAAASVGTWFGAPGYAFSRNPYVNRESLQPWGAVYYTAYATVDTSNTALGLTVKAPATGEYGSDHCGPVPTGAFKCDPADWWLNSDGKSLRTDWQVVPGQTYNLLDIDCYDATVVRGTDANTGHLSDRPCAR